MLILIGQVFTNFLFITMNAQLYIPSHRYSSIDIQFDISKVETQLFDISLTFQLNQVSLCLNRHRHTIKLIQYLTFLPATTHKRKTLLIAISKILITFKLNMKKESPAISID